MDSILSLFHQAAIKNADKPAIILNKQVLTYAQLENISNHLAANLIQRGLTSGQVAAIMLRQSVYLPALILAVLKTGAAYLPLDAEYPSERLSFMLRDAQADCLICENELLSTTLDYQGQKWPLQELLNQSSPVQLPECEPSSESLAIVLYTSGSTGRPKGIKIPLRALNHYVNIYRQLTELNSQSRTSSYASFSFDAHVLEIYPPLCSGATLYFIPQEIRLNFPKLSRFIEDNQISHAFMTTQAAFRFVNGFDSQSLRLLITGGEKLPSFTPNKHYRVLNLYGPTETLCSVSGFFVDKYYENIPIGYPHQGSRFYILNEKQQPLSNDKWGELYIASPQIMLGYIGREFEEKQALYPNPFYDPQHDEPYYRYLYRSGDRAMLTNKGCYLIGGRLDRQIKVRGFRIEPSEIEECLSKYPGVNSVAVKAWPSAQGLTLTAYFTAEGPLSEKEMLKFFANRKPRYMTPRLVRLDKMPLNVNNKIDYASLPPLSAELEKSEQGALVTAAEDATCQASPTTLGHEGSRCGKAAPTTALLRSIIGAIIKQEHFSEHDDFWNLGLNSLGLISLLAEIYKQTGLSLEATDLYRYRNLELLARYLNELLGKEKENNGLRAEKRRSYPLSAVQRGVYLDAVRWPAKCIYNNPILIKFAKSHTDLPSLRTALEQVIAAYPSLKTYLRESFNDESEFEARLYIDEPEPFKIVIKEIGEGEPQADRDYKIRPFVFLQEKEPFNSEAYLSRFALLHNQSNIYLFADIHHLVTDGQSLTLLLQSLSQAYSGKKLPQDNYKAFNYNLKEEAQRQEKKPEREAAREHFHKLLGSETQDMILPEAKPTLGQGLQGRSFNLSTNKIDSAHLAKICHNLHITPNSLFCAVFGFVLACFKGQDQAFFNSVCNARPQADLNSALGMFTRTYPIKVNLSSDLSIIDFVQQIQQEISANLGFPSYSYAELSADFDLRNLPSLIYQGDFLQSFTFNGQQLTIQQLKHEENGLLALEIYVNAKELRLHFSWQEPLYNLTIIKNLAETYLTALLSFIEVDKLSQVKLLSFQAQEQWQVLNDTNEPYSYVPTVKRFEEAVAKYSKQTALISSGCSLTYAELNKRANALAHFIKSKASSWRNIPIALITERSPYAYIARLAVMKAGAAFMQPDPNWPAARLVAALKNSQPPLILVDANTRQLAELRQALVANALDIALVDLHNFDWSAYSQTNLTEVEHQADDLAYIIYTSGSTGTPKGVMIEEHSLSHLAAPLKGNTQYWAIVEGHKVCLAWCSLTFDVSILEFIAPLCSGLSVLLASEAEIHNPNLLGESMLNHQAEVMACVPSYLLNSLEAENLCQAVAKLKTVILGGEHFSSHLYEQLKQINPQLRIFNCYGPSETTIACSAHLVTKKGDTSLGKPMANTKWAVLNSFQQFLPLGAIGELAIMGEGVGRGYWDDPNQTAKAFINLMGQRAYRSGDLVWWDSQGQMQILGRLDNQVKLNGRRLELDEIKNVLLNYQGVNSAAVIVKEINSQKQICAYFTATEPIDTEKLKNSLRSQLPSYMVPAAFIYVNKLPLNDNGKLDIKSLPDPSSACQIEYATPQNQIERDFCLIFQDILQLANPVGRNDSFFDLGGASLRVTKVVLEAERYGYNITYGEVFNYPTPAALADLVCKKNRRLLQVVATPIDLAKYDYTDINKLLANNTLQGWDPQLRQDPGNIMLTGATGFLGIHILRTFLENYSGHCCCLMRKGKQKNLKSRLQGLLVYYFSSDFEEYFLSDRLTLIEGDITDKATFDKLQDLSIDTLFNCSANVRHFEADDLLDKVNVEGTGNIAAYCLAKNIKLVHISTVSVAGLSLDGKPNPFEPMNEHMLYFGQQMDNKYMLSKFRAERLVFEYMLRGLKAKIMRVGNLMARNQDGEFQINLKANSFANKLRAYNTIGCISYEDSGVSVELSPIDFTAEAILLLAQTPDRCCLFHPFSNRAIYMYDLIKVMRRQGLIVNQCLPDQFVKAFRKALQEQDQSENLSGLIAYRNLTEGHTLSELKADNAYTMQALYRFQFNWPLVSEAYLTKFINSLESLGFFDDFI